MLDLLALEAFVIVADVLNLRDAARRLNCSPSAVSRRLDRAERETGIDLLRRTTLLPRQRGLGLAERRRNVRGSVTARTGAPRAVWHHSPSSRLRKQPCPAARESGMSDDARSTTNTPAEGFSTSRSISSWMARL